jgi:hypothetical protein
MPRCRIEGREIQGKKPLKTLEKLGCEKYVMAKITRVNTVLTVNRFMHGRGC